MQPAPLKQKSLPLISLEKEQAFQTHSDSIYFGLFQLQTDSAASLYLYQSSKLIVKQF
jgi:hypothetical protein